MQWLLSSEWSQAMLWHTINDHRFRSQQTSLSQDIMSVSQTKFSHPSWSCCVACMLTIINIWLISAWLIEKNIKRENNQCCDTSDQGNHWVWPILWGLMIDVSISRKLSRMASLLQQYTSDDGGWCQEKIILCYMSQTDKRLISVRTQEYKESF